MRTAFIALISGAALGFASMSIAAKAADVAPAYPVKAKTAAALAPAWTGFYIGPSVGWTFGSSEGDYTGIPVPVAPMVFYPFDLKPSGAALGGQLGYNVQSGRWLFGIEGDLSWIANADDQIWDPAGSNRYDEIKLLWTAHARGRIGYLFDQYLIYVAGGAAFAGTRNSHYGPTAAPMGPGMLWSERRTRTGYSLGGGIEAALSAQWLVRAEYLYDRFSNEFFDWVPGTRYSNSDLTLNTVRVGVVFRPGW